MILKIKIVNGSNGFDFVLRKQDKINMLPAALLSCLICVIFSCPFSKVAYPKFKGDYRKAIAKLKTFVQEVSKLTVDNRVATHFMFHDISFSKDEKNLAIMYYLTC